MVNFEWPSASIADLPEDDFNKLAVELREPNEGQHGGELARIMAFLGFWRSHKGSNLRVFRGGSVSRYSVSVPITGSPAG